MYDVSDFNETGDLLAQHRLIRNVEISMESWEA